MYLLSWSQVIWSHFIFRYELFPCVTSEMIISIIRTVFRWERFSACYERNIRNRASNERKLLFWCNTRPDVLKTIIHFMLLSDTSGALHWTEKWDRANRDGWRWNERICSSLVWWLSARLVRTERNRTAEERERRRERACVCWQSAWVMKIIRGEMFREQNLCDGNT